MKMIIGAVSEYIRSEGTYFFSEEAEGLFTHVLKSHDLLVIHPREKEMKDGRLPAVDVRTRTRGMVSVENLNTIFFGLVGKEIFKFDEINCLAEELPEFCRLLEFLRPYEQDEKSEGVNFVNPSQSILYNLSKDYIDEMSKSTDLPFIPSEKITSLERLVELARGSERMLAKPLISERSMGAVLLNTMSDVDLAEYASVFLEPVSCFDDSLYSQVIARQGVIVQPYTDDFKKYGETKLAVVDGEVTLARSNHSEKDIVNYCDNAEVRPREPTAEERELARWAFYEFSSQYPVRFMRLDLVGPNGGQRINEIEIINPYFATMDKIFTSEQYAHHYDALLKTFLTVKKKVA